MTAQTIPTAEDIRRYNRWATRLGVMCEAYRRLEAAIGTGREVALRRKFQDAAIEPDKLMPPSRWESWEVLGAAIYGRIQIR